jgi:hypothetical protein
MTMLHPNKYIFIWGIDSLIAILRDRIEDKYSENSDSYKKVLNLWYGLSLKASESLTPYYPIVT